jgi:acyl carrier protein
MIPEHWSDCDLRRVSVSDTDDSQKVFEDLRKIFSSILEIPFDLMTQDTRISDLSHVESIKLLRMAGEIERRFGVALNDEVVFRNGSLGDIVSEILKLRTQAEGGAG